MQNKSFRTGPTAIPAAATNILNGVVTSLTGPTGITLTQPVLTLKHFRVVNKSASAVPLSMFIGATAGSAAGTEFAYSATPVPANGYVEWFGNLRLESGDFLTALAGTVTTLVFEGEGEVGFQ